MKITVENGTAKVFTPYHKMFVENIKNIGGRKWCPSEKCWTVPESEIGTVRKYMQEVFGETDLPDAEGKVTVKVTFTADAIAERGAVVLFGKTIARAIGRDSGARVGDEATLIEGKIDSGGSARNWRTVVEEGTTFTVRNVPRAALEMDTEYDVTTEILEEAKIDRAALEEEKERLLARLAEIEKLLA